MRKHALNVERGRSRTIANLAASIKYSSNAWQEEELAHLFSLQSSKLRQLMGSNSNGDVSGCEKIATAHSPTHQQKIPSTSLDKCSSTKSESMSKLPDSQQIPSSHSAKHQTHPVPTSPSLALDMTSTLTLPAVANKQSSGLSADTSNIKSSSQTNSITHIQVGSLRLNLNCVCTFPNN